MGFIHLTNYLWKRMSIMMMMMMMMMMINCFCGMVDRRKAFSRISSWDHCQRSSPSGNSDTPRAEFEPAQNMSLGLVGWSCVVMITTTLFDQLEHYLLSDLNHWYQVLFSVTTRVSQAIGWTTILFFCRGITANASPGFFIYELELRQQGQR